MGCQDDGDIDPTLRALKKRGRYQWLQLAAITIGRIGAAYQLLGNIFIGRQVTSHQCAAPENDSLLASDAQLNASVWNTSTVTYGSCEIAVSKDNNSADSERYGCVYGYDYGFRRELSFRTEFDLVCDRKLLGALAQTFVILGQGIGAVIASSISDRFGRKMVLVMSQMGMLILGVAAGFAPSYAVLVVLKFLLGAFQQGVITSIATMSLELFPAETRSVSYLVASTLFGLSNCSMALWAFLMQHYSWRYLQIALSAVSLLAFLQWWYLDESLRWLVANGRKEATLKVLKRAARVNRVDLTHVIKTLEASTSHEENGTLVSTISGPVHHQDSNDLTSMPEVDAELEHTLEEKQTQKLTLLDIFRHRRLLGFAAVMWCAWFTCAFSYFALYSMSTSLHGNRFLNFFLTAITEVMPGIIVYLLADRIGRKMSIRGLYVVAGFGLLSSGVCRMYPDIAALQTLSVVTAMFGMLGASGTFDALFFYTPELFPTNMRNQAVGIASFVGRLGGMLAPFMNALAEEAVWAPGALIGSLCFLVVIVMHFLPETKGRELPNTIQDIELWFCDQPDDESGTREEERNGAVPM